MSDSKDTTNSAAHDGDRYEELLKEANSIQGVSHWQDAMRQLRKNRAAIWSFRFLITVCVLAFVTPILPLQSPIAPDLENKQFKPPSTTKASLKLTDDLKKDIDKLWNKPSGITRIMIHARLKAFGTWCVPSLFGNDQAGRDVLSRVFWGARVSIIVGVVATLVSLLIGVTYGAVAGYVGGTVDAAMMRFVDILYSIPFIFVVIYLITVLSEEEIKQVMDSWGISRIMIFYVLIGAIYWLTMSRVVRGQVISLKNDQFIEAARVVGANWWRIVYRHLVPNVMGIVIVYLTLTIPAVMLFEAFLSFLGLGVEPPDVSWGSLVNDGIEAITPIRIYWWLVLFPGLAFALTLYALNFLGDGLRDALDPRLKNG